MPVDLKPRRGGHSSGGHSSGGHSSGGHSSGSHSGGKHSGSGSKPKKPKGSRPIAGGGHRGHHNTSSSSSISSTEKKKHKKTSTKESHKKTKTKDDNKSKTKKHKKSKTDAPSSTTKTAHDKHKDQVTSYHSVPTTLTLRTMAQRDLSMGIPTITSTPENYSSDGPTSVSTISCADDFTGVSLNMLFCVAGGIMGLFVVFFAVYRIFSRTNRDQKDYLEKDVYFTQLPISKGSEENMDEKQEEHFGLMEQKNEGL